MGATFVNLVKLVKTRFRISMVCVASAVAGCSALQVDVDVYKGPLVNHESMQRDQMVSMAMSAKALLLSMRNRVIESARPYWIDAQKDLEWRLRTLKREEIQNLTTCHSTDSNGYCTPLRKQSANLRADNLNLRNLRQINDILTFYDNQGEDGISPLIDRLGDHRGEYLDWMLAAARETRATSDKRLTNPATSPALLKAQLSLRDQWLDLVEIFAKAQDTALDFAPDVRRQVLSRSAEGLADLTQPRLISCALKITQTSVSLLRLDGETNGLFTKDFNTRWNSVDFVAARKALKWQLQKDAQTTLLALRDADQILRYATTEQLDSCKLDPAKPLTTQPDNEGKYWDDRTELRLPNIRLVGVVRIARPKEQTGGSFEELADFAGPLQTLGGSGFDRGRARDGIDHLATLIAQQRAATRVGVRESQKDLGDEKIAELEKRLDQSLVDLAARMQFLASNLWLLDERPSGSVGIDSVDVGYSGGGPSQQQINRYKALLEGIANNILVHADDLRHRAAHVERQRDLVPVERNAARFRAGGDGQSFRRVVAAISNEKDRVAKAEAANADTALTQELSAARAKALRTGATLGAATESFRSMAALSALLVKPSANDVRHAKLDSFGDFADDRTRIEAKLLTDSNPPQAVKLEEVRTQLEDVLNADATGVSGPGLASSPRAKRYAAALSAVKSLRPLNAADSLPRTAAVIELRKQVLESRDSLRSLMDDAFSANDEAEGAVKGLDQRQRTQTQVASAPVSAHGVASSKFDAAIDAINAQRAAVDAVIADLNGPVDARVVGSVIVSKLDAVAADASIKQASLDARRVLGSLLPSLNTVQLAGDTSGKEQKDAIEVLDATIAQLRHLHLEAIQRDSKDGAEARRVLEALNAARQQREDMIYLRPTSSYLRSVYASTFLQNDPGLNGRNLLLDSWRRMFRCTFTQVETCEIRAELDKTHWQNVNTVRLDGVGNTNFVIAKDDVGNWYVKAMGNDPKAMINAVKGLALYNMGGRFNTDLLRVDELRARVDDRTLAEPDRTRASQELDKLTSTTSGPAVGARSETLSLFKSNYTERSKEDLGAVSRSLQGDVLLNQIRTRWDTRFTGNPRAKLDEAASVAEVNQLLLDARTAAAGPTAGGSTGDAIVSTLATVHKWRNALKAQIGKVDALTDVERQALAAAQGRLNSANELLTQAQADHKVAFDAATVVFGKFASANSTADKTEITTANKLVEEKKATVDLRLTEVETRRSELAVADAKLQEVKGKQQAAIADVDSVLLTFVDNATKRRIQLVQETETAVKVVGRTSNGATAADGAGKPAGGTP